MTRYEPKAPDTLLPLQPHTLSARAGHMRGNWRGSEPTSMPIFQSTAAEFHSAQLMDDAMKGGGFVYTRASNPTTAAFEREMCVLEGASCAVAVASGMAAIHVALLAVLKAGDHVVATRHIYGVAHALLTQHLKKYGIEVDFADFSDVESVRAALRPHTKVLYAETITNPTLRVCDLSALASLRADVTLIVDNTFATPLLCQPHRHGAGIVVHSATKYLGGHSDVSAGVITCTDAYAKAVESTAILTGPTLDPMAAWLLIRGLKTLTLRVEKQCQGAAELAERLRAHVGVSRVYYPSAPLRSALVGGGAMVSIDVAGDVHRLLAAMSEIPLVPSLGGTMTTLTHPVTSSHRFIPPAERLEQGIGESLIRISVGCEAVQDLWPVFAQALDAAL